jgi:hypothetical protein
MDDDEFNLEALSKNNAEKEARERAAIAKAAQGDKELERILLETKSVQKDTLESTKRSVKTLNETIQTADRTNEKLTAQGEQLDRIAETATRADQNADESYQHARDLRKYDGFIPVSLKNIFTGSKKKQQDRDREEAQRQYSAGKNPAPADSNKAAGPTLAPGTAAASGPKKQFADETEAEIDQNLDEISKGLTHLKTTGLSMQAKMKEQEKTMQYIDATTAHTDYTINSAGHKIQKYE